MKKRIKAAVFILLAVIMAFSSAAVCAGAADTSADVTNVIVYIGDMALYPGFKFQKNDERFPEKSLAEFKEFNSQKLVKDEADLAGWLIWGAYYDNGETLVITGDGLGFAHAANANATRLNVKADKFDHLVLVPVYNRQLSFPIYNGAERMEENREISSCYMSDFRVDTPFNEFMPAMSKSKDAVITGWNIWSTENRDGIYYAADIIGTWPTDKDISFVEYARFTDPYFTINGSSSPCILEPIFYRPYSFVKQPSSADRSIAVNDPDAVISYEWYRRKTSDIPAEDPMVGDMISINGCDYEKVSGANGAALPSDADEGIYVCTVKFENGIVLTSEEVGSELIFNDVTPDDWFYEGIKFLNEGNICKGISENLFGPELPVTRAMFATILWRVEGSPEVSQNTNFKDIASGSYYERAMLWAEKNGIINGYTAAEVRPNGHISREQICAILCRYAGYKGIETSGFDGISLDGYTDGALVGSYAVPGMKWALGKGLINGKAASTLAPGGTASRAEMSVIVYRFVKNIMSK